MEDKKQIDRLFQEKLKDYEVFPDEHVWKNIEKRLTKKEKRRVVPLWLRFGSAAAILLLLASGAFWVFNSDDTINSPVKEEQITPVVVDEDNNNLKAPETENNQEEEIVNSSGKNNTNFVQEKEERIQESKFEVQDNIIATSSTKEERQSTPLNQKAASVNSSDSAETQMYNSETQNIPQKDIQNAIAKVDANNEAAKEKSENQNLQEAVVVDTPELKDIEQVLKENEEAVVFDPEEKQKKWSVGTLVAPVFFNTLQDGSPIDPSLASNSKKTNTSLSYGIKVNYKVNDRLSLQSGVHSVDLAYQTNDVNAQISSSEALAANTNIDTNVKDVNIVTFSAVNIANQTFELSAPQQSSSFNLTGDLNQSMSYLEIPLEAKYSLLQKKFGVNVIGGLSTYVLYQNRISLSNDVETTTLGEASNLNDVNFSGNVGLDLDYKINKKLYMNVTPMFKYQFNTFSKNDGGFRPYYLGVYTGLNFRF